MTDRTTVRGMLQQLQVMGRLYSLWE